MIEIVRTNNPVLISFIEATLKEADLFVAVLDSNASILDGSIGMLPRRVMISDEDADAVRKVLMDTEAQDELLPAFLNRI
jgi:putative signal transducing protein